MEINFEEDIQEKPTSEDALARLSQLAEEQVLAEQLVLTKEKELTQAKEQLRILSEQVIPDLMEEVGMEEFKTSSGLHLKVKDVLKASLTKEKAPEGVAWLEEHGFGNIVKRELVAAFNKNEEEKAREFAKLAQEKNFMVAIEASVHWQTLTSFVKEQMAKGEEVPEELFGVVQFKQTKVG